MFEDVRRALHATSLIGAFLSANMLVPAAVNAADGSGAWEGFAWAALLSGAFWAFLSVATRGARPALTVRSGIVLVNMLWWGVPLLTALPLMTGPAGLGYVDALFETVSGLTTTGSTVLTGLDGRDSGTLLWRSLLQWYGGTGILSLGLILLPFLNIGGMQLFRMESSDTSEKVLPRFAAIVRAIVGIYAALTLACALGYRFTGMSWFDAANHAMTTLSTGGYSTHDASMGHFRNTATLWVGSLFMMLAGLPFTLMIAMARRRGNAPRDPQVMWYLAVILGATALIMLGRAAVQPLTARSVAEDMFDVISVITTTGYAAGDYTSWGTIAGPLFFLLTFFGGCSGSTAGGLKIYRLVVLIEMVRANLRRVVVPNGVFPMYYGDARVDPELFRAALVMTAAFAGITGLLTLLLGALGLDLVTALSGAVTALANVGPGLGEVIGPASTFQSLGADAKLALAAGMIAGRLEILVVLALFVPALWR
ncbi:MAG: TrkH family potassium uptake protein [Alphaproteobacteria bacterium]|nr:MAG: TrkH family potassium uptake protein [Alphaproteobacteria bacterium]